MSTLDSANVVATTKYNKIPAAEQKCKLCTPCYTQEEGYYTYNAKIPNNSCKNIFLKMERKGGEISHLPLTEGVCSIY